MYNKNKNPIRLKHNIEFVEIQGKVTFFLFFSRHWIVSSMSKVYTPCMSFRRRCIKKIKSLALRQIYLKTERYRWSLLYVLHFFESPEEILNQNLSYLVELVGENRCAVNISQKQLFIRHHSHKIQYFWWTEKFWVAGNY